mmetsp:Transcript_124406/g.323235  ORF Transcript_124406/g.323235 Transcript_124406/m.323235 type:complete len:1346 (-) Transcript_124406:232-4269(-)
MSLGGDAQAFRPVIGGGVGGRLLGLRESNQALADLKTKLEFALSRLNDQDTQRTGVEEIREFLQTLYPDWFPMVISCIGEAGANLKPLGRCESVKLLGLLAELHGETVVPLLQRILNVVVTRLQDADLHLREACAETVFRLASSLVLDGPEGSSVFASLLKPLFTALGEHSKSLQIGAAACICSVIQGSPSFVLRENLGRLSARLVQHLNLPLLVAKPQLLSALVFAMQNVESADFDEILPSLMPCLENCLTATSDWQTRKQAVEVLQTIGDSPELGASMGVPLPQDPCMRPTPLQRRIAPAFEALKSDKVRAVRETAKDALMRWSIATKTLASHVQMAAASNRASSPSPITTASSLPGAGGGAPTWAESREQAAPPARPVNAERRGPTAARSTSPTPASWMDRGQAADRGQTRAPAVQPVQPAPPVQLAQQVPLAPAAPPAPPAPQAPPALPVAFTEESVAGSAAGSVDQLGASPESQSSLARSKASASQQKLEPLDPESEAAQKATAADRAARKNAVKAALSGADLAVTQKPKPSRERVSLFKRPQNPAFFGSTPAGSGVVAEHGGRFDVDMSVETPTSRDAAGEALQYPEDMDGESMGEDNLPSTGVGGVGDMASNSSSRRATPTAALAASNAGEEQPPLLPDDRSFFETDMGHRQPGGDGQELPASAGDEPDIANSAPSSSRRAAGAAAPIGVGQGLPSPRGRQVGSGGGVIDEASPGLASSPASATVPVPRRRVMPVGGAASAPNTTRQDGVSPAVLAPAAVGGGVRSSAAARRRPGAPAPGPISPRAVTSQIETADVSAPTTTPAAATAAEGNWSWEDQPVGPAAKRTNGNGSGGAAGGGFAFNSVGTPAAAPAAVGGGQCGSLGSEELERLSSQFQTLLERVNSLEEEKQLTEKQMVDRFQHLQQAYQTQVERLEQQSRTVEAQEAQIVAQEQLITAQAHQLAQQEERLQELDQRLQEQDQRLQEQDQQLSEQDQVLQEHEAQMQQQDSQLQQQDQLIEHQTQQISDQGEQLERQSNQFEQHKVLISDLVVASQQAQEQLKLLQEQQQRLQQQQQQQTAFKSEAEEARAQLAEKEKKLGDVEAQLHTTLEELKSKEHELHRAQEKEQELHIAQERFDLQRAQETALEAAKVRAEERAHEMEEMVRRLETEQKRLTAEVSQLQEVNAKHRTVEQELRDLRCNAAVLEKSLRDAQEEHQRADQAKQAAEQERQRSEQERRQWEACYSQWQGECDALKAENEGLKRENGELKRENEVLRRDVSDFDNAARQDRWNANIIINGDYRRLVKEMAREVPYRCENDQLKAKLSEMQCELHDLRQHQQHQQQHQQQQAEAYQREHP